MSFLHLFAPVYALFGLRGAATALARDGGPPRCLSSLASHMSGQVARPKRRQVVALQGHELSKPSSLTDKPRGC